MALIWAWVGCWAEAMPAKAAKAKTMRAAATARGAKPNRRSIMELPPGASLKYAAATEGDRGADSTVWSDDFARAAIGC